MAGVRYLNSRELWKGLRELGRKRGKWLAVPYYSADTDIRCYRGDTVLVNASVEAIQSGQTSARVLLSAHSRGAEVHSLPSLHAKILWTPERAIVSSANASQSSVNRLLEAGVELTDRVQLDRLSADLDRMALSSVALGKRDLETLAKLKVVRSGHRPGKPSLYELLEARDERVGDVAYGYCVDNEHRSEPESEIRRQAEVRDFRLPAGWTHYDYLIADRDILAENERKCRDRPMCIFEVSWGADSKIGRFLARRPEIRPFVFGYRGRDGVVAVFGPSGHVAPFAPAKDFRQLVRQLNKGWTAARPALRARVSNKYAIIEPTDLQRLFDLGAE